MKRTHFLMLLLALTASPALGASRDALMKAASLDGLQPKALNAALSSYAWAQDHKKLGVNQRILTVVDFTRPSYKKRMWVMDLKLNKVLMTLYTTQGKRSGLVYAVHFSNHWNSDQSSLGLYKTAGTYVGHHGRAMRLVGLESTNSNALGRGVVIHSATYATPDFIKRHHRAGRSWGCFAVDPAIKDTLLDEVKGGSALFAYYQKKRVSK
jgi:hypothetical protein